MNLKKFKIQRTSLNYNIGMRTNNKLLYYYNICMTTYIKLFFILFFLNQVKNCKKKNFCVNISQNKVNMKNGKFE